jgi:hypothetical protein
VPLYRDPRSDMPVTQFDMKYVEGAGLVKFDFLGLKTLTVIETARKLIAARDIAIDPALLPLDDAAKAKLDTLIQKAVDLRSAEAGGARPDPGAALSLRLGGILAVGKLDSAQRTTLESLQTRLDAARSAEQRYGTADADELRAIGAELRATLGPQSVFGATLLSLGGFDPAKAATTTTSTSTSTSGTSTST